MLFPRKYVEQGISIIFCLIIIGSLLNITLFWSPTLFPILAFSFFTSILFFLSSLKYHPVIRLNNFLLTLLGMVCYFLIQPILLGNVPSVFQLAFLAYLQFFILATILSKHNILEKNFFHSHIKFLVCLEIIVCLFQKFIIKSSLNKYFEVSGTLTNPNHTAAFLVLALPLLLFKTQNSEKTNYKYYLLVSLLCFCLILLKSRMAISLSIIYLCWHWLTNQANTNKKFLIIAAIILGLGFSLFQITESKGLIPGRILAWKIMLKESPKRPLFGYGLGQFEKNYNISQGSFFQNNVATKEEVYYATYLKSCNNDFVQLLYDGGMVALFLYMAFLYFIFKGIWYNRLKEHSYYLQIFIGFVFLSFFNSMMLSPSSMAIFLFTVASVHSEPTLDTTKKEKDLFKNRIIFNITSVFVIAFAAMFAIKYYQLSTSAKLSPAKRIEKYYFNKNPYPLVGEINLQMAKEFLKQKKLDNAVKGFKIAETTSSDPQIFAGLSNSYFKLGKIDSSILEMEKLHWMVPGKMATSYNLVKLNLINRDTLKAVYWAKNLLTLKIKGSESAGIFYQEFARNTIKKYGK